jgi:putative restriction endonuclease
MAINLVIAVTDEAWFQQLRQEPSIPEVNFWAPGGNAHFRALDPGEVFLFKLHSPRNFIVGGGIFAHASLMPCSLAWESFGIANGVKSLGEMRARIIKYRRVSTDHREDFTIGCRILTQPFFWPEFEWIPVPESFSLRTVRFKRYSTEESDGLRLWTTVCDRFSRHENDHVLKEHDEYEVAERYGSPKLIRPRLGQGGFRMMVTDAYNRKCAVTGEKVLPALEAAHIKPYSAGGPHEVANGLLLRRDIHSLFDAGYVTVTKDLRFEVSRKVKEQFHNGREYYSLHGRKILLPDGSDMRPKPSWLEWHNSEAYLG